MYRDISFYVNARPPHKSCYAEKETTTDACPKRYAVLLSAQS
ncbi:MAG: hypothetical protein OJF50_000877 [Nitrospira sp.]|nr:hypothetical protein [Nitrospira sp.]